MRTWVFLIMLLVSVPLLLFYGFVFARTHFHERKGRYVKNVDIKSSCLSLTTTSDASVDVRWEDVVLVALDVTAEGPFVEDVFWEIADLRGEIYRIPQGLATSQELLERFQKLPGFDNEAVIEAMQTTRNARFVCWRAMDS